MINIMQISNSFMNTRQALKNAIHDLRTCPGSMGCADSTAAVLNNTSQLDAGLRQAAAFARKVGHPAAAAIEAAHMAAETLAKAASALIVGVPCPVSPEPYERLLEALDGSDGINRKWAEAARILEGGR